jgi:nucleoside-diphosphate-sugar epimerase
LIAVTGATGFIGSVLCAELRQKGYRVQALVRNPDKAQHLADLGVDLIKGDLADGAALHRLMANTTAVIHAAGAVRGSCQQDFDHINVSGTARLLGVLEDQPQHPRLLLLSSLAAREPDLSWYAASKRAGEALLTDYPGLDWLVVRPPAVYGPGDKEMLPVFRAMARGIATVPGETTARMSLIHVTDLVAALISCLQTGATRQQTLTLCDGRDNGYNWHEMADLAAAVWGRKVRLWQVPKWLLDCLAQINVRSARLTARAPMLTPPKLRELRHTDWVVDNRVITQLTGWRPSIGLQQGMELLGHL